MGGPQPTCSASCLPAIPGQAPPRSVQSLGIAADFTDGADGPEGRLAGKWARARASRTGAGLAEERLGQAPSRDRVDVIGHTPSDAAAGRLLARAPWQWPPARTTSRRSRTSTRWWAVAELPPPDEFVGRLGLAPAVG